MRVISGRAGGRRLEPVPGRSTRPTADRVRESLFAILGTDVVGAVVLDLFAGTGALGIEALSRGARFCVFVDKDRAACDTIRRNLEALGMAADSVVLRHDALRELAKAARLAGRCGGDVRADSPHEAKYDLIFADPPYVWSEFELFFQSIENAGVAAPDSIVVLEYSARSSPPPKCGAFSRVREERYGDTKVGLYKLSSEG